MNAKQRVCTYMEDNSRVIVLFPDEFQALIEEAKRLQESTNV